MGSVTFHNTAADGWYIFDAIQLEPELCKPVGNAEHTLGGIRLLKVSTMLIDHR